MGIKEVAKSKLKQISSGLNYKVSIRLNNKKYVIPIMKNMGLLNLAIKQDWFSELLKSLKLPADTSFIDVGVNVGQTLLTFRSHYNNPYFGFEPNPSCVFYLNTLTELNKMKNTHILPVGLSSDSTLAKFYLKNEVDSAGTIVKDLRPDYYEEEKVSYVPLFVFDELQLDSIKNISLIKIDVEGAELEVISGMVNTLKKHKPIIICEILDCHSEKSVMPMQERADKLISIIKSAGYEVFRITHSDKKIRLEKMERVKLKLWTPESFDLNDYLFVPEGTKPIHYS